MQHIWDTVVDNVVCLLVLLPLMGACLVHVVSVFGTETIRRSVITNVLLTCGLAVVMVVHYNPTTAVSAAAHSSNSTAPLFQMISDVYWVAELGPKSEPSGLDIRFTVGVDGISLWFIVLTVLLSYARHCRQFAQSGSSRHVLLVGLAVGIVFDWFVRCSGRRTVLHLS